MSLIYELLSRVGFLPWDSDVVPDELRALTARHAGSHPSVARTRTR